MTTGVEVQNKEEHQIPEKDTTKPVSVDEDQHAKELEKEEIEKHSKEMWLTKQFIQRPVMVMGITIVVVIISLVISIAIEGFKQDEASDREYLIWDDERVVNLDLFFLMRKKFMQGQQGEGIPERSQNMDDWGTSIVVKCEDCDEDKFNVLKVENIKAMYEVEQKILNHKRFGEFCLSNGVDGGCRDDVFVSFTQQFDDVPNLTQDQLDAKINEIVNDEAQFTLWKGFFGKTLTADNKQSSIIRNQIKFGGPLKYENKDKLYKDIFDKEVDQRKLYEDFVEIMLDICRDQVKKPDGLRIIPANRVISDYETFQQVQKDFALALGSIIFVWLYIAIHLRSLFLASMGMLNILYSFPLTMVVFGGILQITYFSTLHVIVIFIVLGIAADNVFVFTDAWNQSEKIELLKGDYNKRMAYTFRRAAKAMLATSSTTGAAFLATGLSEIMPISSFGFFAGILIPMNYILVITYYPASLMVFEKYTKNMCVRKKKVSKSQEDMENQQQVQEKEQEQAQHPVERVFNNQINTFVFKARYFIMVFFVIWTGIAIWRATQLPGLSEQVSFLPDDYDVQDGIDSLTNDFHQAGNSDQGIKVYQFWGVNKITKKGVSMWDPLDRGDLVWDNSFNLAKNQQYFYDYCVKMQSEKIVQDGNIRSFILPFKQFIEQGGKTFPVPEANFITDLKAFIETDIGGIFFNNNMIGLINDELKYVSIQLSSHGRPHAPRSEIKPYYDEWEDHIDQSNKDAPEGLKGSKQTALLYWVFMVTERALVTNAMQGILISMAFAFVVLVMTSYNLIISFYSVLCIGGIVVSVVSIIEMVGWELGVSESVAIVILIGLSVDYVVHLANHYVECTYEDRFRKTQVALRDLGISIVAGASTTLGSSLFLFFATITLFNKFAILIYTTIIFSLLYSIGLFSAIMHAFGPEHGLGDISKYFRKNKDGENKEKQAGKDADVDVVVK